MTRRERRRAAGTGTPEAPQGPGESRRAVYGTAVLLVALVGAIYARTSGHGFVGLDDGQYVIENAYVRSGLGGPGIAWAFSTFHTGNWHPLTWISHMADVDLFGLWAGGHHLVNALFHAGNAVLLFLVLRKMTGCAVRSGIVAALFAAHPLHVESVAWVSERKDLLCALFFLLSVRAYAAYAERPGAARYAAVALFFVAALLSKPMAVTLPFVLLLLDWWPLGRLRGSRPAPGETGDRAISPARAVLEKVPLLLLSLGSAVVTLAAQRSVGAASSLDAVPFGARVANALVSYAAYLWKTFWPAALSVFYPHPATAGGGLPGWQVAASASVLAAVTAASLWQAGRRPWLAVGWLWYLGMLVPVIGLLQVGAQSMADRYTYLPLVGVFVALTWGAHDLFARRASRPLVAGVVAVGVVVALSAASWRQAGYWERGESLFRRALAIQPGNWMAHKALAQDLIEQGRNGEALAHLRAALAVRPQDTQALNNLGIALYRQGRREQAAACFREALRVDPAMAQAHFNLGVLLEEQGRAAEAAGHYLQAGRGGALAPPPAGGPAAR